MNYNKQWRPSEKHHRNYAPYQRAALKNKNWHSSEEANAILKEHNNWRHKYRYYRQYDINLEENLLLKFVGKPFKEFEIEWHKHTKMLRQRGVDCELYCINPAWSGNPENWNYKWYYSFLVDDDGIIQKNPIHPKWKSEKKPVKIIEKEIITYNLMSNIYDRERGIHYVVKHTPIMRILKQHFGKEHFRMILDGDLTEAQIKKLSNLSLINGCHQALYKYCKEYNKNLKKWQIYSTCRYDSFERLFYKDTHKSIYKYIYPGTQEYTRYFAELKKARNKELRDGKLYKKNINETLLHDIEAKRKSEERRINDETIERHGFDKYESFRGEPYHGKKHKRKPRHYDIEIQKEFQNIIEKLGDKLV